MPHAKLEVKGVYSEVSDFSTARTKFKPAAFTLTPDEYMHLEIDTPFTLDTGMFGTITLLVIKNSSSTPITARIDTDATANVDVVIPANGIFATPDVKVSEDLVLTPATGTPKCEIFIIGT